MSEEDQTEKPNEEETKEEDKPKKDEKLIEDEKPKDKEEKPKEDEEKPKEDEEKTTEEEKKKDDPMEEEKPEEETKEEEEAKEEKEEAKEEEEKPKEVEETPKEKEEKDTKEVEEEEPKEDKSSEKEDAPEKEEKEADKEDAPEKEEKEADKEEPKEEKEAPAKEDSEKSDDKSDKDKMEVDKEPPKTPPKKRGRKRKSKDPPIIPENLAPSGHTRERKKANVYEPEDFANEKQSKGVGKAIVGRGKKLSDISCVVHAVGSHKAGSPSLAAAHKLLFGGPRGRASNANKRHYRSQILAFSGYLTPIEDGEDKDKRAQIDEDAETIMAQRAFKLTMPVLKNMCDFFDIDRSPPEGKTVLDKEGVIDRLLDFLGSPDEKLTKTYIKKGTPSKKRRKSTTPTKKRARAKSAKVAEEYDDDDEETEEEESDVEEATPVKDELPTDKELQKWVRAYITCFNLDKATTKHAMETASDKFGVDLSAKKMYIKALLADEMSSKDEK